MINRLNVTTPLQCKPKTQKMGFQKSEIPNFPQGSCDKIDLRSTPLRRPNPNTPPAVYVPIIRMSPVEAQEAELR